MEISDDELKHLGMLARLEFSDEQASLYKKQIGEILGYIEQLNELETDGVEPMESAAGDSKLREDVATNDNSAEARDANLKGAPSVKDGFIVVPKVFE
jgi:aspartyl-tRNA(Asn)/glutamyl-tRNA(Gln) amidotransferase subunit C